MGQDIFSIVGSALGAQNQRMGAIASNLANIDSITPQGQQPYRAHELVFAAAPVSDGETEGGSGGSSTDALNGGQMGVQVVDTVQSNADPVRKYDPSSPYADKTGFVTGSNVSQADQMVDLIDSSNSYSASVAVLQQAARIDQQIISSFQVT